MVHQVTINHSKALLKEADHHLTSEGQLEGMLERFSVAANGLGEPTLQSKLHSPIQKCVDAIERCIQWRSQLQPLAEILRRNTQLHERIALKAACSEFARLKKDLDTTLKQVADDLHFNKAMAQLVDYQPFDNLTFTQVSRPAECQPEMRRLKYA